MDLDERYSRQKDLVPPDRLGEAKVTIVGTGAIGRQIALQLAAIGVPEIQIIDFDVVETGNLAAQGFLEEDLDEKKPIPKVVAVGRLCEKINSTIKIEAINSRYRKSTKVHPIVFACVDDMDTRKFIWEEVRDKADLWVDGRMSAEVLRILTAGDEIQKKHYDTTLFASAEAYTGSCTAKTTIYSSNIIAGMMVCSFTRYLRQLPLDADVSLNLLANEIIVENPK